MRCREVQDELGRFAAGELTAPERATIEAHLGSCAACRESLARLRRLEALLAAAPAPPLPEGFAARVVARAKERQAATGRRAGRPRPPRSAWDRLRFTATTAAALAAGLLLGLFMGRATWEPARRPLPLAAAQPADPVVASGFQVLVEPDGDSLAQIYLQLTAASDR
jgi:anti-sigma factor RsiW